MFDFFTCVAKMKLDGQNECIFLKNIQKIRRKINRFAEGAKYDPYPT